MWGQKQSAMIAETMLRIFSDYNDEFSIVEGVDDVIREHNKGFSYIYYSQQSLKNADENGKKYLNERAATEILQLMEETKSKAMEFYKRVSNLDYAKLSDKETLKIIREYRMHMIRMNKIYRTSDPSSTSGIEAEIKKGSSTILGFHHPA